ncbi:MAG: hypothetical protein JO197_06885 [Acidobacteria bacterium]|nr:hypothetical protein [Acidobacteriota bacterium]MBV9477579.1 hypothetical protein [Acidobacteriota bacterium]
MLAIRPDRPDAAKSDTDRREPAQPEYLVRVGGRLVPVTRASLERLGIRIPARG